MLKSVEEVSPTKKRLKIEIPQEAIEQEIRAELGRLKERTRMPGFRPGKAPMSLVEKKFGKDVEGEVLQKLLPQYYSRALEEASLKPVGNPEFEHADEFRRTESFNMIIAVEVFPEIKDLQYQGIKVKDVETKVEEKEVDEVLERLRQDKALYEPTEEPLSAGDIAVIDYEIKEEEKSYEAQVFKVGSPSMPEEFSKALTGRKKGDQFEVKVKFPEEFPAKDVAGKELTFSVKLKDTKKMKLPDINDEFAKDLGRETLEDLRAHVREEIVNSKKNTLRRMQKAEAMRKLVEKYDFEVPESLLESELSNLAEEALAAGQYASPDEAREALREAALKNVKASILLDIIGEKEKVSVSEDDIRQRIAEMSRRSSLPPENIIKYYVSRQGSLEGLRHAIYEEKVLDLLVDKAELEKEEK